MKKLIKIILPVFGILIFNTMGVTAHASVSSSHNMHGSMQSNRSLSCASLCLGMPSNKGTEDEIYFENEDDDDFEVPSYVSLLDPVSLTAVHTAEARIATDFNPPPGPPLYIMNTQLRF